MKLKKLILEGFKSFADKTEFEFDEGVSCIVGPNGCGKSNVVDAIKWVLGEQSAKSLRGSDMADVIFNGSANRRPAGTAQVTLIFDNGSGILRPAGQDAQGAAQTVSVARRLFRNGHSDYLINKQPARLKDIREMFMDTGLGRDAYSVIEQGRVEVFLQSSREDRRAAFDEAAGISKYKARKKEAIRKLERVEQNMLRLSDVLGEVLKRLRSIKYQAGKARSYQVHSERLKELRSLHLLGGYHELSARRKELQGRLDASCDELAGVTARIGQLEAAGSATELEMVDLERSGADVQKQIADVGASILTLQERTEMLGRRVEELGEQTIALCSRCETTEAKIVSHNQQVAGRRDELHRLEADSDRLAARCESVASEHDAARKLLRQLQDRLEDEKAGTIDLLRRTAELHNEIQSQGLRRKDLAAQRQRLAERAGVLGRQLEELLRQRARENEKLKDVQDILSESHQRLDAAKRQQQEVFAQRLERQRALAEARERRSGLLSRIEALGEMQDRLEGIGAGAKAILEAGRSGQVPVIRGMLGQFIQTDVAHGPMVEAALCGAEEHLLAGRQSDVIDAAGQLERLLGEAGSAQIICLDKVPAPEDDLGVADIPGAIGRLIDSVQFPPDLAPLMKRLLGKTVIVAGLPDAVRAAAAAPGGVRFVTLAGDVLEADGRIRIRATRAAAGLITRRSELVQLADEQRELDRRIEQLDERLGESAGRADHLEGVIQKLRTVIYEANTERTAGQSRTDQLNERIGAVEKEQPVIASDLDELAGQIERAVAAEHEAKACAEELDRRNAERRRAVAQLNDQIAEAQKSQDDLGAELTQLRIDQAAADEKKVAAAAALAALAEQAEQMNRDLAAGRAEIDATRNRRAEAEAQIREARARVDELYARQQELDRTAAETAESRRGLTEKLEQIRTQLIERRKAKDAAAARVNELKVELSEVDVRVENLIARAAEDLGMDLPKLFVDYTHDDQRDWDAVASEIDSLRQKIERLGNVNLDAIDEQDELENRRQFLASQLDDINASRAKLTELIRRINTESRQRFTETFQAIRENFQELFRKLFGGGKADIMLLDPDDVLESPIEIFARPPGKELRSLSLLSGGEKTMTALALLFSIFKARPSPFCLLDEVDAALDETNNDRFNRLVRQFVPDSQFLIISHAKRTIAMANVLYGVTMGEPGVSRRISVRFDQIADEKIDEVLAPVEA